MVVDYSKVEMPNGASVADWLGTAGNSAKLAAAFLDDMRIRNTAAHVIIGRIENELVQALSEVRAINQELIEVKRRYVQGEGDEQSNSNTN